MTPAQSPVRRPSVAVLGPGGIGGLFAALLARQGHPVTCIARPATAGHLAEHGLKLTSSMFGDAVVCVESATRLERPVDVVLITVKANQLSQALDAIPSERLGDALVVPFLNGIDHVAWLRERYPPEQVVAGTIRVESTRVGPGVIVHSSPFAVVEIAGGTADHARVDELGARLAETGLDVTVREDQAATLWSKLSVLAPIALVTTLAAAPFGEARASHWDAIEAVVHEIVQAAVADGVELDEAATISILQGVPDSMRSSMQKDAAAQRPIELDAIGGSILRAAERAGVQAPATARLVSDLERLTGT